MNKHHRIALLILSVALILAACQSAPEEVAPAPEVEEAPAAALPADSPGGIFQAAMEGVETEVSIFFEGIPVPEEGSVSMEDDTRMDFITSLTIEECIDFYRKTFPELGLIEIEELAKSTDFSATLVFGGYPRGKAIEVKVSRFSDTARNIKVFILDPAELK